MMMTLRSGRFFGHTLRRRRVEHLQFVESCHAACSRLDRHVHDRPYFCVNDEGEYVETFGRRKRVCRRGMIVFHPAGETHSQAHETDVRSLNVEVSDAWMRLLSDEAGPLDVPVEFPEGALAGAGARLLAAWHLDDSDSALECDALSWEILGAAARRSHLRSGDQAPRWVRDAREILEASFRNSVGLPELARSAGVHPVHFAAVFRRNYGCSVGEYRRRLRLAFVCRQLACAKPSLAEIAQQAGFSDQSHMTRTFKQFTGNTPGAYRRRLKRGHRDHVGLGV